MEEGGFEGVVARSQAQWVPETAHIAPKHATTTKPSSPPRSYRILAAMARGSASYAGKRVVAPVVRPSTRRARSMPVVEARKVAVLGAAGGIGQPLSLLLKMNKLVTELALYDIANVKGVAADLSHCNTPVKVRLGPVGRRPGGSGCAFDTTAHNSIRAGGVLLLCAVVAAQAVDFRALGLGLRV